MLIWRFYSYPEAATENLLVSLVLAILIQRLYLAVMIAASEKYTVQCTCVLLKHFVDLMD